MRDRLSIDPARERIDLSLYLVTDRALCGPRGVAAVVADAVAGGVTAVQVRDKHASDADLLHQLEHLAAAIAGRAALIVNDRLDVAVEARARGIRVDGVHLGQSDTAATAARAALGPSAIVGLTANTADQLAAVARMPHGTVDYVGVGVIRPTTTKPDHPPALGVDGFAALAAASPVPCVAIGGIRETDARALRAAGAAGIAVVSAVCAADDPRRAAESFVRAVDAVSRARPAAPRVLSIAGSDPSGGAGIQADLKSIAAVGGYGMAAITALTAQNTRGVRAVHVPPASVLRDQLHAVSEDVTVDAVKVGMLATSDVIRTVTDWIATVRPPVFVLDPVMVATSGDRLLDQDAEAALHDLLPLADLVTPNLDELAALLEEARAVDWAETLAQAERLSARFGLRVLAKGGHLDGNLAPDVLVDANAATVVTFGTERFDGERIATTATHGTGCSLASAVATLRVSQGAWEPAITEARRWLRESIRHGAALDVGRGRGPISHFAGIWSRGSTVTRPHPAEVEAEWWADLTDLRRGIDDLPFVRGLADGSLARSAFLAYLAQDAHYLGEYARVLAEAARIAPDRRAQAFWASSANAAVAEELALHAHWLGGEHERAVVEPDSVTTAYVDHLLACVARGDYGVLVAAALPCFWLYTDLGGRLAAGELGAATLSPEHPYAAWLATYSDPAFAEATRTAVAIVTDAASRATPEMRERMRRAFRVSAEHELAFFDRAPGVG